MNISIRDSSLLYLSNKLGKWFPFKNWEKRQKLTKLYNVGIERIENELNIVKLLNTHRNFKILLKNSLMDENTK